MGLFDFLKPAPVVESIADVSLHLEDRGWRHLTEDPDTVSDVARLNAARDARALVVAHPLVRRGVALRCSYVHGNGGPQVTVEHENPDVAETIAAWWGMPENVKAVTGPEARARLERSLTTDGNVFIAAFTQPKTGVVRLRTLPFEEITAIHTDPGDRLTVQFYERRHTVNDREQVTLYPDITHQPARRPTMVDGKPVRWDAPVRHVKINDLDGWLYGLSDLVSIAPWARAYRDFLADWAKLMRSLSQFAWRATADGKRARRAAQALTRMPAGVPELGSSAGATYVQGVGESLEAIPKTGATIDADSGRPILAMIASGLDVPITMLTGDPGVTGARATAETLDEPMYLAMQTRRDVWASAYRDLTDYTIEAAVRAPQGPLHGVIVRDEWAQTERAELDGTVPVVKVAWPDLSTNTVSELVNALATADATGKLPPLTIARELLTALGVENIDDVLDELTDDNGEWRDPYRTVGGVLTRAVRDGADPASLLDQFGRFGGDE